MQLSALPPRNCSYAEDILDMDPGRWPTAIYDLGDMAQHACDLVGALGHVYPLDNVWSDISKKLDEICDALTNLEEGTLRSQLARMHVHSVSALQLLRRRYLCETDDALLIIDTALQALSRRIVAAFAPL